jgi:hypothetical protein
MASIEINPVMFKAKLKNWQDKMSFSNRTWLAKEIWIWEKTFEKIIQRKVISTWMLAKLRKLWFTY